MRNGLFLASSSPYRATLLARLGIPFVTEAAGIEEVEVGGESPRERAARLARAKAEAVARRHPDAWALGSDQVVFCEGRVHDKPGDATRCRLQLAASSGRSVQFFTAVALVGPAMRELREHVDRTVVHFRVLGGPEIARYVELDRPLDCAGGFRSEGRGVLLFRSIETSDPAALVGLPLIWVANALRVAGFDPLATGQT